jgi:hypothetical protein
MTWLTPEQEAAHALESGIARSDLAEKAKLAYDWLVQHAHATAQAPAPAASTDDKPSQPDEAARPPATPPPAPVASTGDEQLQLDGVSASRPGPELGTVGDTQLWGADFGEIAP